MKNMLENIPADIPEEVFETIVQAEHIKIERILSKGHSTPPTSWYNQDFDEWVIVLQGAASIEFDNLKSPKSLNKGDFLWIPAHQKHRVVWTPADTVTIWLAIHIW